MPQERKPIHEGYTPKNNTDVQKGYTPEHRVDGGVKPINGPVNYGKPPVTPPAPKK